MDAVRERVNVYDIRELMPLKCRIAYQEIWDSGPGTLDDFQRQGFRYSDDDEALTWLCDQNCLAEDSDGWYHAVPLPDTIERITAYELKRRARDWKEALRQAKSNLTSIADRAYVVMDRDSVSTPLKHEEQFEEENIGLLSSTRCELREHIQASNTRSICEFETRFRLSESVFERILSNNSVFECERKTKDGLRSRYRTVQTAQIGSEIFRDE